jgi:hypothetical protein
LKKRANADRSVPRFGYVSISRASHQATIFTDDMAKLTVVRKNSVRESKSLKNRGFERIQSQVE